MLSSDAILDVSQISFDNFRQLVSTDTRLSPEKAVERFETLQAFVNDNYETSYGQIALSDGKAKDEARERTQSLALMGYRAMHLAPQLNNERFDAAVTDFYILGLNRKLEWTAHRTLGFSKDYDRELINHLLQANEEKGGSALSPRAEGILVVQSGLLKVFDKDFSGLEAVEKGSDLLNDPKDGDMTCAANGYRQIYLHHWREAVQALIAGESDRFNRGAKTALSFAQKMDVAANYPGVKSISNQEFQRNAIAQEKPPIEALTSDKKLAEVVASFLEKYNSDYTPDPDVTSEFLLPFFQVASTLLLRRGSLENSADVIESVYHAARKNEVAAERFGPVNVGLNKLLQAWAAKYMTLSSSDSFASSLLLEAAERDIVITGKRADLAFYITEFENL